MVSNNQFKQLIITCLQTVIGFQVINIDNPKKKYRFFYLFLI